MCYCECSLTLRTFVQFRATFRKWTMISWLIQVSLLDDAGNEASALDRGDIISLVDNYGEKRGDCL